ncbi:hypothetical protein ABDI30_20870 [Paenibacillus cisolokensis]|uniref:hypothetical protein n=1 Tax=Paenibacillus cisolokensis TaxID=1658519 RepID=UPI003D276713
MSWWMWCLNIAGLAVLVYLFLQSGQRVVQQTSAACTAADLCAHIGGGFAGMD